MTKKAKSYIHPQGWIEVHLQDDGSYRIPVDDNGHGLFRFYSADDIVGEPEENRDFAAVVAAFVHILNFSKWGMEEEARDNLPDIGDDWDDLLPF